MDVTCPRCQTDYEFDDALVSERGTTVKCTNCGHQFRVFRPRNSTGGASAAPPEIWRIERRDAEALELRSLVELQRAIRAGRVTRGDLLRRGEGPPRRVGDIPELDPFFPPANLAARVSAGAPDPTVPKAYERSVERHPLMRTAAFGSFDPSMQTGPAPGRGFGATTLVHGSDPSQNPPLGGTTQQYAAPRADSVAAPPPARPPSVIPPTPRTTHRLMTPAGIAAPAVAPDSAPAGVPLPPAPLPTRDLPASVPPPRPAPPPPGGEERASLEEIAAQLDPPPVRRQPEPPAIEEPQRSLRPERAPFAGSLDDGDALDDELFPPSRRPRRGGRAITVLVALVVLAGMGFLAMTVGRPYIRRLATLGGFGPADPGPAPAPRLQAALSEGERAMREGDASGAREAYLRATVVDERSAAGWDGLCAAEAELGMTHWIAGLATGSSLEREQAASTGASAGRSCARWGELARAVDPGGKKVEVDLRPARSLAAQGDAAGVRIYVPAHRGDGLVEALALLADATAKDPSEVTAAARAAAVPVGRMSVASLETPGDLALAAFVSAAAGQPARYQEALGELTRRAPHHMLLDELRKLGAGAAGGSATANAGLAERPDAVASPDARADSLVASATPPIWNPTASPGLGAEGPRPVQAGDYRSLNEQANRALANGDVSRAETLYRGALGQHSGDIDALYGLGQIARSRGDLAGATDYFRQVLDQSAGFTPARLALADAQWAAGNKTEATHNYEVYLERVSDGPGADRARSRIGATKGESSPAPVATGSP